MRQRLVIFLALSLAARTVCAQDVAIEPPKIGQPADFSQLVGTFRISAEAQPMAVAVEEPLTLSVTISGRAADGWAPQRERLKIFPDGLKRDFFVEPIREQAKEGVWEFVYQLRPKHARVQFVPSLKLVSYGPQQRRYQTAYSDAIPLTVTPRREAVVTVPGLKVVQAPAGFFELVDQKETDSWNMSSLLQIRPTTLVILALAPPLLCFVAVLYWRRRRQTALVRERRNRRVVEATLAALARASNDPSGTLRCVTEYLRQRLEFDVVEPTPAEVERWLKRRGVARPVREQWRRLLQNYDAGRFAPAAGHPAVAESSSAIALVRALEEQPCFAGQ